MIKEQEDISGTDLSKFKMLIQIYGTKENCNIKIHIFNRFNKTHIRTHIKHIYVSILVHFIQMCCILYI